jgi:hypothetical protein
LLTAAREPYGARAVVYVLLLAPPDDVELRAGQLRVLHEAAEPGIGVLTERLIDAASRMPTAGRLPLLDACLPTLDALSERQAAVFLEQVRALVEADGRVSLWEWAASRLVRRRLGASPGYDVGQPRGGRARRQDAAAVVEAVVRATSSESASQAAAWAAALRASGLTGLDRPAAGTLTWSRMDAALARLERLAPTGKRRLIAGIEAAAMHDRQVTVDEAQLVRAVCDGLGVPVPPLEVERAAVRG